MDTTDKAKAWDAIAEKNAEIARLRNGIQDYLDGNFGHIFKNKRDTCPHGRFGWEDCGNCIDAHFSQLLGETCMLRQGEQ